MVRREYVEKLNGAEFANIFDDSNECIGVAMENVANKKNITA
jgi:hypothetical protein